MKIDQLTIKELKQNLAEMEVSDRLVSRLRQDPRQGVQKLADRYLRILEKRRQARQQWERGNEK
ncbi:MAG: ribonuclease HII, partial [Bacillota bacterium]